MPYVKTEPVESSNIERIGYLRQQQILRVVFKGGRAYDYPLVPERDFRDFQEAESKGSFFNRRIKPLYGHRNPRSVELVEPCCEHDGSDTCTKACDPCNEYCCPDRPSEASPEEIAAAIRGGLAFGAVDRNTASETEADKAVRFAEAYGASPAVVAQIRADYDAGHSGAVVQVGSDEELNRTRADVDVEVPPAVPRTPDGEIDVAAIPDATPLFDGDADTVIETVDTDEDETVCKHANIESLADGSNAVCASCGVDLSQSGDCPHGTDGRTCEEGCGCIPCHVTQDEQAESPEAEAHSKALNEMQEINEEEENNGNSD